jgi:hypothetical protein
MAALKALPLSGHLRQVRMMLVDLHSFLAGCGTAADTTVADACVTVPFI